MSTIYYARVCRREVSNKKSPRFLRVIFFAVMFLLLASLTQAQQLTNVKVEVPEGMELKEISPGYQVLVPKGIKMEMVGNQVKIESDRVYFLRRFLEMEKRLEKLEASQKELQQLLQQLKGEGVEKLRQDQEQLSQEIQRLKKSVTELPQTGQASTEDR